MLSSSFAADPWIEITLNGVNAAISHPLLKGTGHLTVCAPSERRDDGTYYSAVVEEYLPNEQDDSAFAKLYRTIQVFADSGVLKGPWGEDHPLIYNRFEYMSLTLSPKEILSQLEYAGVSIEVKSVFYRKRRHVEFGTKKAEENKLRAEVTEMVGQWMSPELEIHVDINEEPKPMTPEEKEAMYARVDELMRNGPTIFELLLFMPIARLFSWIRRIRMS